MCREETLVVGVDESEVDELEQERVIRKLVVRAGLVREDLEALEEFECLGISPTEVLRRGVRCFLSLGFDFVGAADIINPAALLPHPLTLDLGVRDSHDLLR